MNKSLLSKWFEQGAFFFLTLLSNSDPKLYLRYIYWANSKIILRSLCLHHSHGHLSKWLDDKNNNCHATLPLMKPDLSGYWYCISYCFFPRLIFMFVFYIPVQEFTTSCLYNKRVYTSLVETHSSIFRRAAAYIATCDKKMVLGKIRI